MQTPGRFLTPPTNPVQWLFSGEAWRTMNAKQILLFVLSPVFTAAFRPQYERMCSRVFVSDHRVSYPESAVNTLLDLLMAKCTRYNDMTPSCRHSLRPTPGHCLPLSAPGNTATPAHLAFLPTPSALSPLASLWPLTVPALPTGLHP